MIFCGLDPLQKLLILPTMLHSMADLDWPMVKVKFHDKLTPTDTDPLAIEKVNETIDMIEGFVAEITRLLHQRENSTIEFPEKGSDEN